MSVRTAIPEIDGLAMFALAEKLYPIFRSITGEGVRQTLRALAQIIPLEIHEIPTGTQVFDWCIPEEWNVEQAWIADESGRRIVDIADSNLHLVNYSSPVRTKLPWRELRTRLTTLPQHKDWIPYRTAYYESTWGFCLSHRQYEQLAALGDDREYDVCIETSRSAGSLTYGELVLPGETDEEFLFSTHVCHPSLANDNLSGIAVAAFLAAELEQRPRKYSYRFLFLPATIGPIAWLSTNPEILPRIRHGLVLALLGDAAPLSYKASRTPNAEINRAVTHVLHHSGRPHSLLKFEPNGYDERQYCSPGVNLPVGCLMRSRNGEFPEYHTSADNLDFISPKFLDEALRTCLQIVEVVDRNGRYRNLSPMGEPRLGPRGLYRAFGRDPDGGRLQQAVQWVLNYSDGDHNLLEIAELSGLPFARLAEAKDLLVECELLCPHTG